MATSKLPHVGTPRQIPRRVPPEGPAEHCRNALQLLDEVQALLLLDPRCGLPMNETLRTLAGARDRVWQAVWELEGRIR